MRSGGISRGPARDIVASTFILVWMLLFSVLVLKSHYALARLSAEVEANTAQAGVTSLERRIAALERQIERPDDAGTSSDAALSHTPTTPVRRRMK